MFGKCLEVVSSGGRGRYIVAKAAIPAGSVVLRSKCAGHTGQFQAFRVLAQ